MNSNRPLRLLALTDHATHIPGESIYPLLREVARHPRCEELLIASRAHPDNAGFFQACRPQPLTVSRVGADFEFRNRERIFQEETLSCSLDQMDALLLRVDRPVSDRFLDFIGSQMPGKKIINDPAGIIETGSKAFLLNFPKLCPPMRLCRNWQDAWNFSEHFPIVLKPLTGYGGKGLIRLDRNTAKGWLQDEAMDLDQLKIIVEQRTQNQPHLAMKFLPNYHQGDKRVLVVNGEVLGAMLRVPKKGSWLCNLSQGGAAGFAEADQDELRIAEAITPALVERGVVIFGFDTLVDDDGKRCLSEINVLNVGGFYEAELYSDRPVVKLAAEAIWAYLLDKQTIS